MAVFVSPVFAVVNLAACLLVCCVGLNGTSSPAMIAGGFVKSGGPELAHKLEANGYDWLEPKSEVKT